MWLVASAHTGAFDADRDLNVQLTFSGVSETMKFVISHPQLRDISFGAFAFGGLQSIFAGFFILFLIDGLDYTEAEAGSAFAIAAFTAVAARIFWGYLGSTLFSARTILGGLGFWTLAAVLTSFYDASWSYSLILLVAILYNITSLSWHGILLAEIAYYRRPTEWAASPAVCCLYECGYDDLSRALRGIAGHHGLIQCWFPRLFYSGIDFRHYLSASTDRCTVDSFHPARDWLVFAAGPADLWRCHRDGGGSHRDISSVSTTGLKLTRVQMPAASNLAIDGFDLRYILRRYDPNLSFTSRNNVLDGTFRWLPVPR